MIGTAVCVLIQGAFDQNAGEKCIRVPEFDTIQLHGGQRPDTATNARAVPIYASTSFVFNNSAVRHQFPSAKIVLLTTIQHGADLFNLRYDF